MTVADGVNEEQNRLEGKVPEWRNVPLNGSNRYGKIKVQGGREEARSN